MQKSDTTTPQHGLPLKSEADAGAGKRNQELLDNEIDRDELVVPSAGIKGIGEPVAKHDPRANRRPADQEQPPRAKGP